MLPVDSLFKSASHGNRAFSKNSDVYGEDAKTKSMMQKPRERVKTIGSVQHETDFKLSRRGHGDPIGKYPPFVDTVLNKNYTGNKRQLLKKEEKLK